LTLIIRVHSFFMPGIKAFSLKKITNNTGKEEGDKEAKKIVSIQVASSQLSDA